MKSIDCVLYDICDLLVPTDEKKDDSILEQLELLKSTMKPEQILLLNKIIDEINNEDAGEKYKAFKMGVLCGVHLSNN
jgi:predicted nucleic acid-binding OB-fold protein